MSTEIARRLVEKLLERGETVAAAESCTGGLISAAITSVAGSSQVHWGGAVTYANDAKIGILGINPAILSAEGTVSSAVAKSMAWGMRTVSGADWTISATGIAGPGGGTPENPVGTVWLAWCGPLGTIEARKFLFSGDRDEVRAAAVNAALLGLLESVEKEGA